MVSKERRLKIIEIIERAEKEHLYSGERISLMMDIESADSQ